MREIEKVSELTKMGILWPTAVAPGGDGVNEGGSDGGDRVWKKMVDGGNGGGDLVVVGEL